MGFNTNGAISGAAGGAAAGSVFGPWGTAIGGIGGGLYGAFSGGDDTKPQTTYRDQGQIDQAIAGGLGSANGIAPQLDPVQQAQFRQMQMQQAQQLQRIASGQQQGAGELAAQRQVANAQAQQQAMARMARGGNAALAARGAAMQSAGVGLAGAGQAQQAAMQDQLGAQQMLTGALGQGRGQDIGFAGQNANLMQQQYGLNTQRGLGYLNADIGMNSAQSGQEFDQWNKEQKNLADLQGGAMNAAGSVLAAKYKSDETLKTDVSDAGGDIDAMLDGLRAKTYRYKDDRHGKGKRAGIMAQDALKSKAGAAMVVAEPDGLAIDVNKAMSAVLAASARLNQRLRAVEGKNK